MFITPNSGQWEVKPTVRVYIENSEFIEGSVKKSISVKEVILCVLMGTKRNVSLNCFMCLGIK